MDDNDDAFDALTQTIEALKLAGVDEDIIANHLFAKFIALRERSGLSLEEIAEQVGEFFESV
jgi:hypothetical protein